MKARKIKYKKHKLSVAALVPFDLMSCSYWPFAYYLLDEVINKKKAPEIKRDWKLKPKDMIETDTKIADSIKMAIKKSLSITDELHDELKQDETTYNILLSEIYAVSYQLTPIEKYFTPQKMINKEFAEGLAAKSKALQIEPYSFIADLSREKPDLFNPKRYDFNYFILGVGWEMERKAQENALKDMEKQQSKIKARR